MAAVLRRADGDDDLVTEARQDLVVATRAAVGLHRLVGLHVADLDVGFVRVHPNSAHATSAPTTTRAAARITTSLVRRACARNGLSPTPVR